MTNTYNMKKILLISLTLIYGVSVWAALEPDLRKGVDLTASNFVSQSLLNQLVDNGTIWNSGYITNNRGIIMRSTIRPDVTLNPRMTNWLWLDCSAGLPGTLKQYIPTGDTDTNWVQATIGNQQIINANIKDYTIGSTKLATNSVLNYAIVDSAIDGPKLAAQAVTAGKIGPSAVSNANIAPSTITGDRIALNTISNGNLYDYTVFANKIAPGAIMDFHITNYPGGGLTGSNVLKAFSLTGTNIVNGGISNAQLASAAVDSNKIATATININNLDTNLVALHPFAVGNYEVGNVSFRGVGISSVTPTGTGKYRLNFTTTRSTTNYAVVVSNIGAYNGSITRQTGYFSNTVTSVHVAFEDSAGSPANPVAFSFAVYDFTLP